MPTNRAGKVFAPSLGLRVRMWLALFLNAVLLVVLLVVAAAVVTTEDGWAIVGMFILLALAGAAGGERSRRRAKRHEARLGEQAERALSRLSMTADIPPLGDRIEQLERLEARLQAG